MRDFFGTREEKSPCAATPVRSVEKDGGYFYKNKANTAASDSSGAVLLFWLYLQHLFGLAYGIVETGTKPVARPFAGCGRSECRCIGKDAADGGYGQLDGAEVDVRKRRLST